MINDEVRDPIHDYIDLTPVEVKLVDAPAYQRLRWIKQLRPSKFGYLVQITRRHMKLLHGAESRSWKDGRFNKLDGEQKQLAKISGLLHDLGHCIFIWEMEIEGVEDHEIRTTQIIKESEISNILSNEGIDCNVVNQVITGKHQLGPWYQEI